MNTPKFRYYITDIGMGEITGTNDGETAQSLAESDVFFVVDTHTNKWVALGGEQHTITEYTDQ